MHGDMRNAYKVLIGKPKGRVLGRSRPKWGGKCMYLKRID
jgi:hypothetical protein